MNAQGAMLPVLLIGALGGVAIGLGGAPFEAQGVAFVGAMLVYAGLRVLCHRHDPRGPSHRHDLRGPSHRHDLCGPSHLHDLSHRHDSRSRTHAMAYGLVVGFAANATTCAWLSDLLHDYAFMPWPVAWLVAALLFALQGAPFVATALIASEFAPRSLPMPFAWPLVVVVSSSAIPMLFPWRMGISQLGFLPFVQLAELGGLPLVDFALALITALFAEALLHPSPRVRIASFVSALLLLAGVTLWGTARIDEVRAARASQPLLRVGIVQHNIDIPERMHLELWPMQMESTWSLTRAVEAQHVDVVMWPESAFPWYVDRHALAQLPSDMELEGAGIEGPILFGAPSWASQDTRFNSVLLTTRTRFVGLVDKTRMMPFSERIPLWNWLLFLHPFMGPGLTEGPENGGVLEIPLRDDAHARAGILNCYEDLMDDHVQRVARQSPSFLSNHTNDAWFGPTRAPRLHHFLARLRAIETRRDLVRTVNTGVSGHVSATGESLMTTEPYTTTARVVDVRLAHAMTLWVWLGDWLTPLCYVWLFGALWNRAQSARRR